MASLWKRVDLLSLSSVTSAAAAKRRAPLAGPLTSTSKEVRDLNKASRESQGDKVRSTTRSAQTDNAFVHESEVNASGGYASIHTNATRSATLPSDITAAPDTAACASTAVAATRVSISRLLSAPSLTWQASLACFVALAERGQGASLMEKTNEEKTSQGSGNLKRSCGKDVVPLEAILSVYGMLQRVTQHPASRAEMKKDETSMEEACWAAAAEHKENCQSGSAEALSMEIKSGDVRTAGERALCSPTVTPALRFLAYASQHHAALTPIACVLTEIFGSDDARAFSTSFSAAGGLEDTPSVAQRHEKETLSRADRERLSRLLSVSTILHVGLREVLQESMEKDSTATPTAAQQQQRWAALRTVHHLERYGGARDYLQALREAQLFNSLTGIHGSHSPVSSLSCASKTFQFFTRLTEECGSSSAGACRAMPMLQPSDTTSTSGQEPHNAARHASSPVHAAIEVLCAAVHELPTFTPLFRTLQQAWETHHAQRLASTSVSEFQRMPDTAASVSSESDEMSACVTDSGSGRSSTVSTSLFEPLRAADAFGDKEEASSTLAMVRALAQPTTGSSRVLPSHRSKLENKSNIDLDSAGGDSLTHSASVSLAELTLLTMDVVHFAWQVMLVRGLAKCTSASHNSTCADGDAENEKREREGEALLELVRTATRFCSFTNVRTWLDRLLPSSAQLNVRTEKSELHCLGGEEVTHQQRAVLLCLLTRAVRRAPSWSVLCTTLEEAWPRLQHACAPPRFGDITEGDQPPTQKDDAEGCVGVLEGFAEHQELLDVFIESPHAPLRRSHTASEVDFWCDVICTPLCGSQNVSESSLHNHPSGLITSASHEEEDGWQKKGEWSKLLYGASLSRPSHALSISMIDRRVAAVTAAAAGLSRQWLQPAGEHAKALHQLAACHAKCAEAWAAVLRATPVLTEPTVQTSVTELAGASVESGSAAARGLALRSLATQHRAFASTFLTAEEKLDWLDAVLRCASPGVPRQLVLAAAARARWSSAETATGHPPRQDTNATQHSDVVRGTPSSASSGPAEMVADLTRVLQRWINASDATSPYSATSPGPRLATGRNGFCSESLTSRAGFQYEGRLGGVGLLVDDIVRAPCPDDLSSSSSATRRAAWTSALTALLTFVRCTVTQVGLRWEHQMGHTPSPQQRATDSAISAAAAKKEAGAPARLPLLFGTAVVHPQRSSDVCGAFSEEGEVGEICNLSSPSSQSRPVTVARLQEWLEFLCTCPPQLLLLLPRADEAHAVVWLYLLMRQVEEVCVGTATEDVSPQRSEATPLVFAETTTTTTAEAAAEGDRVEQQAKAVTQRLETEIDGASAQKTEAAHTLPTAVVWTAQMEEAAVRRAAYSLSQRLWPSLPPDSLLPPMLLNWLLTRGGVQSWAEAVRFLRGAAAAAVASASSSPLHAPTAADQSAAQQDSEEDKPHREDQRRYLFLVLPLDRVVSMSHAMRVLRTLQAVEERCERAAQTQVAELAQGPTGLRAGNKNSTGLHELKHGARPRTSRWRISRTRKGLTSADAGAGCATSGVDDLTAAPPASGCRHEKAENVDNLARHYYRAIERVLLREWYSRAVAAVLEFLLAHPEHTFLTNVEDAPAHAALALRRRLMTANLKKSTLRNGSNVLNAPAHGMGGRGQAATLQVHREEAGEEEGSFVTREWREWLQYFHDAAAGRSASPDALHNDPAAITDFERRIEGAVPQASSDGAVHCTPGLDSDLATDTNPKKERMTLQFEGAEAVENALSGPSLAPLCPLRVPLHFLGAFILQECRIGADLANPAVHQEAGLSASLALSAALINTAADGVAGRDSKHIEKAFASPILASLQVGQLPPFRPLVKALVTDEKLLDGAHPAIGEVKVVSPLAASNAPRPLSQCGFRPLHAELVRLFQRVMQVKKAERAVDDASAASSCFETVEDVVCEIFVHHDSKLYRGPREL